VRAFAHDFTVQITPIYQPTKSIPTYAASEVMNGAFEVHGSSGSFYWHVHASRGALEVEPLRSSVTVHGEGPYTWIV
jgi:hypothetical protein